MSGAPERIAYHEAGHAAAALALGLEVQSVTIERSITGGDGWEIHAGRTFVHRGTDSERYAIVALAGPEASRRWCPNDLQSGMEGDFQDADRALDRAAGDVQLLGIARFAISRANLAQCVRTITDELVRHHWTEIVALAGALLETRTLQGDAVARVFERSLRARGASRYASA